MSQLLELLGRGLQDDLGQVLGHYFRASSRLETEELLRRCREQPGQADLRLQLGLSCLRSSSADEAVEHLRAACQTDGDDMPARLALALRHEERGEPAAALEQLLLADERRPHQPPILLAIGLCLEKLQRPEEAAEAYRKAVALDGGLAPARERLAAVAVVTNRLGEAIEQYQALHELAPEQIWLHTALGHLHYRAGQFDQAIEEFQTAIALEPDNWSLVDEEVEALVAEGMLREAIGRLGELLEEQGDFADLYVRLGDVYAQVGDDESASLNYHRALDLQPNYLEASVKLGTHHLSHGRWDQAAEAFHAAVECNDSLLVNYIALGVAQAAAGRRREALGSFDLAAAIEPNSTLLLTEMARLQLKAAAAREFETSLSPAPAGGGMDAELEHDELLHTQVRRHAEQVCLQPGHADLRFRYGVLLRALGRGQESLEQFTKAVELSPAYVQAVIRLGITQREQGMHDAAITTLRGVLDIPPACVDVHYRLGLLYTDRGQLEQAVRHLEAAAVKGDAEQVRASLALSLQNMGLMDRAAATWRSLWQIHNAARR